MSGIGIDFGTTNSVAAVYDSNSRRPVALRALTDKETGQPHPSVVWFQGDRVIVGREAKQNINGFTTVPGNHFERSIKRRLGQNHIIDVLGERKQAYEVAAEIFRFLVQQAKRDTSIGIQEAVVTIPVRFKGHARRELRKAAGMAGIHIKTFVHEPFAAVIGYCFAAGRDVATMHGSNILVFDWGGGTLDITLARVERSYITELATGGLEDIAGDLFDQRVQRYAENKFLDQYTLRPDILSMLPAGTRDRLNIECELRKIELSMKDRTSVKVAEFLQRDKHVFDLDVPLNRSTFQELIGTDVQAAIAEVDHVLEEARLQRSEVDHVLMIGGSSRIPRIRSEMQRRFGVRVIEVQNGDTIIAEGAAIIAENDWLPFLAKPVQLLLADESFYTVFEERTVLNPVTCQKKITLFCTDNRDGEARLLVAERQRTGDPSSIRMMNSLNIPVNCQLPKPYNHERVYADFYVDEDSHTSCPGTRCY